MISKIALCGAVLLCFSFSASAQTDDRIRTFSPKFPQFSTTKQQRQQENQFYSLGQATFKNQVSLPIYAVTALSPVDDGLLKEFEACTASSCHFDFKLDTQQAKQLKVLALPSLGVILVPRTWVDVQASAGANGSGSAVLMSPDQQEAITLYDSAFCAGCGMPDASLYFPALKQRSLDYDYGAMQDSHKYLSIVYPRQDVAFFSYQIAKYTGKTHGIAQYEEEDSFNFKDIHISLKPDHQPLARTMLNFYHSTH